MNKPKTVEEGVAALAVVLGDEELKKAAEGRYGREVELLVKGEYVRRVDRRRRGSAA